MCIRDRLVAFGIGAAPFSAYAGWILLGFIALGLLTWQPGIFIPNSIEMNAVREVAANMGGSLGSSINISTNAGAQLASDLGKGVIQGTSPVSYTHLPQKRERA